MCSISLFSKAGHPDRKYDYFKIAGFLVINHFGNGGHAIREQPNRDGLSARTFVAHLRDKSKEGLLLKKFMKEPVTPRKW